MALDQTPHIDPLTEPDPNPLRPAPRRKRADRPQPDPEPQRIEGLDPDGDIEEDDKRISPPPHFV